MDIRELPSPVAAGIADHLAHLALGDIDTISFYDECCRQIRDAGFPLLRTQIAFPILHPLHTASTMTWTAGGVSVGAHNDADEQSGAWFQSPVYHMVSQKIDVLRRHLTGPEARLDFPVLKEFRASGGSDYICFATPFKADWNEGTIASWLTDREGGFTEQEIVDLHHITRFLSISFKARIAEQIALNVSTAYLGEAAGRQVLSGAIRRGQGERLTAALFYSDLRGSTALADRLEPEAFLERLNAYFDCSAAAVLAEGGEVVAFVGDAVLGFFRADADEKDACERALSAAEASVAGSADGMTAVTALHFGSFVYGNIGTADRLQFTAIGAAINELARLQDMAKTLSRPILASADFARRTEAQWQDLGEYRLRGVASLVSLAAPLNRTG